MRILYLVAAQLLFFISVSSQPYKSLFGDSSTEWDVITGCPIDGTESYPVFAKGDTVIDGLSYKILVESRKWTYYNYGAIREDTIEGKAWFYNYTNRREYLIMNLSLSLRDTFFIFSYNNKYPFSVDSIFFENGKKNVRLNITITCDIFRKDKVLFIEGSGTNAGLAYQAIGYIDTFSKVLEGAGYMLCHWKDGIRVSHKIKPPYDTIINCDFRDVGIKENKISRAIKIYPNPAIDRLCIYVDEGDRKEHFYEVQNIFGEQVLSGAFSEPSFILNISSFSKGLYILLIDGMSYKFLKR